MKINDEGTSNAAYWYERAMKAEARLQKIMARCADLLDEDQFNELDAMARAAIPTPAPQPSAARCGCPVCCGHPKEAHVFNKHGTLCPDEFDKIPPESP